MQMQFPENVTRLCGQKRFSFGCNPDVSCFTECCRELDLVLSPYDVLNLCKSLQMSSAEFIERYVVQELDENGVFPVLYLGMVDDGRASCPFITAEGCRVYEHRPGACRAYPVGRGVTLDGEGRKLELFVLVREDHCKGFVEEKSYSVTEWFADQGLEEYNRINDEMLTLLQHEKVRSTMKLTGQQMEDFLLALYRLDDFHRLLSSPDSRDRFGLDDEQAASVLAEDLSLLRFGISWLSEELFEEKS